MIERVARAIAKESGNHLWTPFIPQARAAIAAMREPTKEMIPAGLTAIENSMDETSDSYQTYKFPSDDCAYHAWQAMINIALEEK